MYNEELARSAAALWLAMVNLCRAPLEALASQPKQSEKDLEGRQKEV